MVGVTLFALTTKAFEWDDIPHWGSLQSELERSVPVWFDTNRVQQCFCNKHVVLLGDSTGTEYAEMMLLLLDGGWSNKTELDHFVSSLVHSSRWGSTIKMKTTVVTMFPNHRRMRATWDHGSGCKGSMFHRFAGHWKSAATDSDTGRLKAHRSATRFTKMFTMPIF